MGKAAKRKTPTKAEKKKRLEKFQQKRRTDVNVYRNMQTQYVEQMREREDVMRRANLVEGIYRTRPELATIVDDILVLNEETTYLNESDNVVYWKADNNPVVSGLDEFDKFPLYTPEFFNHILGFIQKHEASKAAQTSTDIDLGEFELIEDDIAEEVAEIVNEVAQEVSPSEVAEKS